MIIKILITSIVLLYSPTNVATVYDIKGLMEDEIDRHVAKECTLFKIYGKNPVDYDPIELAVEIWPNLHKKTYKDRATLINIIYPIVRNLGFYKRSKIYDVYYSLCVGKTGELEAEKQITDLLLVKITNEDILSLDRIIKTNYSSDDYEKKTARDVSRAKILLYAIQSAVPGYIGTIRDCKGKLNGTSPDTDFITKKKLSVMQEYVYDIDLWESMIRSMKPNKKSYNKELVQCIIEKKNPLGPIGDCLRKYPSRKGPDCHQWWS